MKLQMQKRPHNGMLLTFCGLDGSGKTTMIGRLNAYLQEQGVQPFLTKQPTPAMRRTHIFRNYMDQPDHTGYDYRALSLMAASDRIQHTNTVIVPALERGELVLSDRYFYSCLANLRARGYTEDRWIYEIGAQILAPDCAFFFDIDVPTALERVRARERERDRFIDVPLQYRLREEYLLIAADVGGEVISTARGEDACFKQMVDCLERNRAYV